MDKMIIVGKFQRRFNEVLNISYCIAGIYRSKGLATHMINRKHFKALKYVDDIPDIINSPDYIGINPNETGKAIEIVKRLKDNILIGIKLDEKNNYYYVSTMFDIPEHKLRRLLHKKRLVEYIDKEKNITYNSDTEKINLDEPEKVPGAPEREPDMVDDKPPTQD